VLELAPDIKIARRLMMGLRYSYFFLIEDIALPAYKRWFLDSNEIAKAI